MRLLISASLLGGLVLVGCSGTRPGDRATGTQAVVAGSHADVGDGGIATFRVTAVGSWPVGRSDDPSKTLGVDASYPLDAGRNVRIEFEGLLRFGNPLVTLVRDARRVQGSVEFVPAESARYVVRGRIGPESSAVWLEDEATHQVVAGSEFKARPKPVELRENTM